MYLIVTSHQRRKNLSSDPTQWFPRIQSYYHYYY